MALWSVLAGPGPFGSTAGSGCGGHGVVRASLVPLSHALGPGPVTSSWLPFVPRCRPLVVTRGLHLDPMAGLFPHRVATLLPTALPWLIAGALLALVSLASILVLLALSRRRVVVTVTDTLHPGRRSVLTRVLIPHVITQTRITARSGWLVRWRSPGIGRRAHAPDTVALVQVRQRGAGWELSTLGPHLYLPDDIPRTRVDLQEMVPVEFAHFTLVMRRPGRARKQPAPVPASRPAGVPADAAQAVAARAPEPVILCAPATSAAGDTPVPASDGSRDEPAGAPHNGLDHDLHHARDGEPLALVVQRPDAGPPVTCTLAKRALSRMGGYLREDADRGEGGLLLYPASSVHTFGMRFPIHIVYISAKGRVLRVQSHVPPWRVGPMVRGTRAILELPADDIPTPPVRVGDALVVAFPFGIRDR